LQVLSPGAPVDVAPGANLQAEITYGNHLTPSHTKGAIRAKIVQDAVNGRTLAFSICLSPISAVSLSVHWVP
jgi:hypothetical protein